MKNSLINLYSNNLIKVIILLLLRLLDKQLSKSINNDFTLGCFQGGLGVIGIIVTIGLFRSLTTRHIIKKPKIEV